MNQTNRRFCWRAARRFFSSGLRCALVDLLVILSKREDLDERASEQSAPVNDAFEQIGRFGVSIQPTQRFRNLSTSREHEHAPSDRCLAHRFEEVDEAV